VKTPKSQQILKDNSKSKRKEMASRKRKVRQTRQWTSHNLNNQQKNRPLRTSQPTRTIKLRKARRIKSKRRKMVKRKKRKKILEKNEK